MIISEFMKNGSLDKYLRVNDLLTRKIKACIYF